MTSFDDRSKNMVFHIFMTGHWLTQMWSLCVEFADRILIFTVLERQLLQLRETDSSFVLLNKQSDLLHRTKVTSRFRHVTYATIRNKILHSEPRTRISTAATCEGTWDVSLLQQMTQTIQFNSIQQATIALRATVACGVSLSNAAQRIRRHTGRWKPRLLCGSHTGLSQGARK